MVYKKFTNRRDREEKRALSYGKEQAAARARSARAAVGVGYCPGLVAIIKRGIKNRATANRSPYKAEAFLGNDIIVCLSYIVKVLMKNSHDA